MHTPTYKSSRTLKKRQDILTKVRRAAASGAQVWWWLERDEGGLLGAGKFPLCDLSGHHTGFHFGILCETEYLCCLHFSVCLLYYPAIKVKETIILLQSSQKPWDSWRLLRNIKLWGKKEEKMLSKGRGESFQETRQLLKIFEVLIRSSTWTVNKTAVSTAQERQPLPLNVMSELWHLNNGADFHPDYYSPLRVKLYFTKTFSGMCRFSPPSHGDWGWHCRWKMILKVFEGSKHFPWSGTWPPLMNTGVTTWESLHRASVTNMLNSTYGGWFFCFLKKMHVVDFWSWLVMNFNAVGSNEGLSSKVQVKISLLSPSLFS